MIDSKLKIGCVSRYELLRQLGQNPLTKVYLAALRNEGEPAELLVLELMRKDKELARDDDFRALFLDRAAATLQLSHPNVIRTHDVVADKEACGLTMEFLEGQPLSSVLERLGRGRVPLFLHLKILCEVLDGLHYAHHFTGPGSSEHGIVHRDAAPRNVFITYDGQVKLLGTGFAQATMALERKLGQPLYDVGYASPELMLGYAAGPSADVFGVGVMLWEALACTRRVFGATPKAVIRQRTSGEEPDIEVICPEAPPELVAICRRALAVSPRDRYATAQELKQDLERYLTNARTEPADTSLTHLASLMKLHFSAELAEMQLFIGSSLGHAERSVPASPKMVSTAAAVLASDTEWNDETHVVAPPAPVPTPELPEVAREVAAASTREVAAASTREPDTGGHRAYSASLVPAPPAAPRISRLTSRLAVPAAAGLALLAATVSILRLSHERGQALSAASEPQGVQTRAAALPALPPVDEATTEPRLQRASEAPDDIAAAPEAKPPGQALEGSLEAVVSAAGERAADPEEQEAELPSAFLGRVPDALPGEGDAQLPALQPSDLPVVDDERDLLQEAILTAARASRRGTETSRHGRFRRTAKRWSKPGEPSEPSDGVGVRPRPIDEADPYAEPELE
jgi:eukaryotic-like serine/threonine-protein kinase